MASKDDRFVIRFYSPITTIGGGHVLILTLPDKRFDEEALARLAIMEEGTLADVILQELQTGLNSVVYRNWCAISE